MSLVSGNIRCMRTFAGVPLGGGLKWEWGGRRLQFWRFERLYFFGNLSDKASNIIWRNATPCRPETDR